MPLGQTAGSRAKIAKLKFALSGQSLAHIRASLQAVAKTAMVDFKRNIMHTKHQKRFKIPLHMQ